MNTLTFLNQPLLWGLSLAAIPLIIHLLFRRRLRKIDWAPMRYLKLSLKRKRRRIRLEQLLLLLLRTVLVVLLFVAVARPVMHAEGLGAWLTGRSRNSQIILLDDSLSMGFRERGRSAFDRGREVALELVKTLGPKDRLTIAVTSQSKAPLRREVEVPDSAEISQLLSGLQITSTHAAWQPILTSLEELVTGGTYPIQDVTIITDLRRSGWEEPVAEIGTQLAGQRVRLRIFDVGNQRTDNIALVGLEPRERAVLVGAPSPWEAVVQNLSAGEVEGLEATLSIDDRPGVVRLPAIAPGETARIPLTATFQEPGLHRLDFKLPGDDLPEDDHRWAVTSVREQLRMVLVDGEPSTDPLAGEVDFVALALSLGIGAAEAWQVEVITDSEWSSGTIAQPDLLVIANLASLTPDQVAEVRRFVESGTGLMIFPGEQLDLDAYNQSLYQDGAGLLPAALESIRDDKLTGLIVEPLANSPLRVLGELAPAVLERIQVNKFLALTLPPEDAGNVRVLARWNNADASPAAVQKTFGRGEVLLWTVTADKGWSEWPTEPSFVLAMREAAQGIVRGEPVVREFVAGTRLTRQVAADREITSGSVLAPAAEQQRPLLVEETRATPTATPVRQLAYDDSRRAGIYRLTWNESQSGTQSDQLAVNPDSRESQLARINADELRGEFGGLDVQIIPAVSGADLPLAVQGEEIWRSLAAILLGLLAVEAGFPTWVGRQR